MICAGRGDLQAVFFSEIPVFLTIRYIGIVYIFKHGKSQLLLEFLFSFQKVAGIAEECF